MEFGAPTHAAPLHHFSFQPRNENSDQETEMKTEINISYVDCVLSVALKSNHVEPIIYQIHVKLLKRYRTG